MRKHPEDNDLYALAIGIALSVLGIGLGTLLDDDRPATLITMYEEPMYAAPDD